MYDAELGNSSHRAVSLILPMRNMFFKFLILNFIYLKKYLIASEFKSLRYKKLSSL